MPGEDDAPPLTFGQRGQRSKVYLPEVDDPIENRILYGNNLDDLKGVNEQVL